MYFFDSLLEGFRLALEMGWQTWWALVLGFTIAGAVEAFVSENKMRRYLGGRGLRSVGLGTVFGAASSSCSFGAVATTKSLFKKGASPEASLAAFQFASTNLVIELGLVMWVLLGWQFVLAVRLRPDPHRFAGHDLSFRHPRPLVRIGAQPCAGGRRRARPQLRHGGRPGSR